ncbi:hypothetical protein ALC53_07998 [Atta colombica]|uniref:Uncharacterized protein n=1 Tax=Atta colombica TaxID=520822 RepID=A0A195BAN6_9HYME|nr:hypothetical protein ALC53_07998 [Atta colombica]
MKWLVKKLCIAGTGLREVVRRLSGARSSELFIPRAMREKKMTAMELAQSKDRRSVNSRFAPPGDESRKATREAVVTLASEIGNCPTNGITNACALAP